MNIRKAALFLRVWATIKRKQILETFLIRKSRAYRPFIILCAPRTGSTLLHTYLNSHPHIHSYGETWKAMLDNEASNEKLLNEHLFKPYSLNIKAVGLKIFYSDYQSSSFQDLVRKIIRLPHLCIIHLVREDTRSMFQSLKKAEKSGVWSTTRNVPAEFVEIDQVDYAVFVQKYQQETEFFNRILNGMDVICLSYEQLVSNTHSALKRVQSFIGVSRKPLYTLLEKQNRKD